LRCSTYDTGPEERKLLGPERGLVALSAKKDVAALVSVDSRRGVERRGASNSPVPALGLYFRTQA
jgi:hypothetical protein